MASFASRALVILGLVFLAHSCYSAYEHSSSTSHLKPSAAAAAASSSSTSSSTISALPLDITLETIISTALICLGLVMSSEQLQPIEWRVWAGKVEKERKGGPYIGLEERMGFVDIRAKRKEFADWVRDQGKGEKT